MGLIGVILDKNDKTAHQACEYYFISYKQGNAGISTVALKTKKGYLDLFNYCNVDESQIEFKKLFIDYVGDVLSNEYISRAKVKELAKTKMDKFNQEKCDFVKKQNETAEKGRILPIHVQ